MKLSYRAKRACALLVLFVLLPIYIVGAVTLIGMFDRPHILIEVGIYAATGILWALPFRAVFRGIGKKDPEGHSQPSDQTK